MTEILPQPLVSVIIPTLHRPAFLTRAIESVLTQTYHHWELWVMDNGGFPDTARALRPFLEDSRIHHVVLPIPGLSNARNEGIRQSQGDFVALLDDDDIWLPDKLALQTPVFAEKNVVAVYGDAHLFSEEGKSRGLFSTHYPPREGKVLKEFFIAPRAVCSTLVFRRSALEKAGLFDPALSIAEEYDLLMRLAPLGNFGYVKEAVAWYRLHSGSALHQNRPRLWKEARAIMERTLILHPELLREDPAAIDRRWAEVDFREGIALLQSGEVLKGARIWGRSFRSHPWTFILAGWEALVLAAQLRLRGHTP